jgi:predicted PurR-regulated permease PerM
MDKLTKISITTGTFIRAIFIGALAYAAWILRDLLLLVITAIVVATAIEPGVMFFAKRKIPRIISVILMYVIVLGSLFSLIYFFVPPILADAQGVVTALPQYLATFDLPNLNVPSLVPVSTEGGTVQTVLNTIFAYRTAFVDSSQGALRLASVFFGGVFSLVLVVVLSFYFALQDTGVEDFLRLVTPSKQEDYVINLWHRAQKKIGQWMQGQLLLSLLIGVTTYLGLLILGVPYALLLAIMAAIFDLIPIFGSFIAGVAATVVAFTAGGIGLAFFVAGLYLIINQLEAHLIYPLVVNKVVGIPPLLVILALTTLPYVNADPHIGNALEFVQADALARAWRASGENVFFNIGTDEHGQKIARAAEKAGKDVNDYVDHYALEFSKLKEALDISYDAFIRTTDAKHIEAAQEMWRRCEAAGDIYKKSYTGLYCVGCEAFKTEKEIVDGHCELHPSLTLEQITEENYFFRFSKYQTRLAEYLSRPEVIVPEWRRTEALNFVSGGLEDFSISRERPAYRGAFRCRAMIRK